MVKFEEVLQEIRDMAEAIEIEEEDEFERRAIHTQMVDRQLDLIESLHRRLIKLEKSIKGC